MREERVTGKRSRLNGVALEVAVDVQNRSPIGLKECHADRVQTSGRLELDACGASRASSAAKRKRLPQALAIKQDFELFSLDGTEATRRHVVAGDRADVEGVFPIRREDVLDQH